MLSYRHAYHAGNAADCHKHLALVLLLKRLQQKATPLCYVDSHAGGWLYDLASAEALKTNDAADGILRLAQASDPPAPVRDYLDGLDWDKRPPPPPLPGEVVSATSSRYVEAYERVTGRSLIRLITSSG